ncbi:MAG: response regulator [Polyangiales bacterium]
MGLNAATPNAAAARIATIEDDPLLRRLEEVWLRDADVEVVSFATGADAIEAIDASFDAIIVDLGLQDVPGLRVVERLRARGIDAPILVVSDWRDLETTIAAMRAGAYDSMTKPLDSSRFVAAVKRACELQRLARRVAGLQAELEVHRARTQRALSTAAGGRASDQTLEPAAAIDDDDTVCLRELERRAIDRALKRSNGRVEQAAKLLGIGRATLYRRLAEVS